MYSFILDYEQVNGDSGDEEEQHNYTRHSNRNSSTSSHCTLSTPIDTNESTEPLNSDSTATESIINMGTNAAPPMEEEQKMATNFDKFRLLMWKNGLLQYRHRVQTVIEILVPVLFSVILILIRSIVDPDIFSENTTYKSFDVSSLKPLRLVFFIQTFTFSPVCECEPQIHKCFQTRSFWKNMAKIEETWHFFIACIAHKCNKNCKANHPKRICQVNCASN